jgi:GTPase
LCLFSGTLCIFNAGKFITIPFQKTFLAMIPVIAIVGRQNVGKSSLFNRILGRRDAVVEDIPGVTRDRNYRPSVWLGQPFYLVDTGGMMPSGSGPLLRSINEQIDIAVDEAAVVLFVAEAGCGITAEDQEISRLLRKKAADRVLLLINKSEAPRMRYEIDTYRKLGLGDPWPVSALHGKGVAEVLDEAVRRIRERGLPDLPGTAYDPLTVRVAVVGRPNAGKSSLVNKLLRKNRMIVDDEPGTTRDSIDSEMVYRERPVILIDTAGLRKKSHVKQDLEYYFNLRALQSIERCDVCVVVIDAIEGLGVQDMRIVNKAFEQRKCVLLAWNKWDLVKKVHTTFDRLVADTRRQCLELRPVPMIAISALTGLRLTGVLDTAFAIKARMTQRVPSAEFEDNVFSWVRAHPHPAIPKDPVRFLGARQLEAPFPLFRFITTNPEGVVSMYARYLTNKIYDAYGFEGCPVGLQFRAAKGPRHQHPLPPGRIEET